GIGGNITSLLDEAEQNSPSYDEFTYNMFSYEVKGREAKQLMLKMKLARLPLNHNLEVYDFNFASGLSVTQLNQLSELNWLDQCYNIMLSGPSGTGKTYISAGLCYDALQRGYKAHFRGMYDILATLRLKELTPTAAKEYKRLSEAQLIVIDDVMTLPLGRDDGNRFFVFLNQIYETTSFIISTNKCPAEWARSVDDETLATALLDRLLYKCQLIQHQGKSYRMQNRQTIF
ncbi:MAG: ATP-binding protein, partial [Bacteroidales bacterium]|nr:ATP-binding protein [Bacteroidales bacterium]